MSNARIGPATRGLTVTTAALFGVLGLVMFVVPAWASMHFAWSVSPFVTMTMGGWCLGNAAIGAAAARTGSWPLVHPSVLYLGTFSVLQLAVVVAFRDRLRLDHPIAWLYLAALGIGALTALVALVEVVRRRPTWSAGGRPLRPPARAGVVAFVVVVAVLAVGGAQAELGGLSSEATVFPEQLSLFTIRAFAAFFAALAIGSLPLIWSRSVEPALHYVRPALVLIVTIMAAAVVHFDAFDLRARPGGWLYLGAYAIVGVATAISVTNHRIRRRDRAAADGGR